MTGISRHALADASGDVFRIALLNRASPVGYVIGRRYAIRAEVVGGFGLTQSGWENGDVAHKRGTRLAIEDGGGTLLKSVTFDNLIQAGSVCWQQVS